MALKAFQNAAGERCPIFVQHDVQVRDLVEPEIRDNGGIVTSTPDAAVVVVILDRKTILGSELVAEYAGDGPANNKAVVKRDWVTASVQGGQMLGPPEFGGHRLRRHTVQSFFGQSELEVDEPNIAPAPVQENRLAATVVQPESPTNQASEADRRQSSPPTQDSNGTDLRPPHPSTPGPDDDDELDGGSPPRELPNALSLNHGSEHRGTEVETSQSKNLGTARRSDVSRETSAGRKPGLSKSMNQRTVDSDYNQRSALNASPSPDMSPRVDLSASDDEMIPRDSGTVRSTSSSRTNSQDDSAPGAAQDDVPVHDRDAGLDNDPPPEAPPRHNETTKGRHKFTKTDVDYLVRYLAWGRNRDQSKNEIYTGAAEQMPWHSAASIRRYVQQNPEHFGNPEKPEKPSQRSRKPLSEYRQIQVVDDVRWEEDQMNNSDGEADDDEEPNHLDFADSDNHVYSDDDTESFHDFPESSDGSDAGTDLDPDDPAFHDPFARNRCDPNDPAYDIIPIDIRALYSSDEEEQFPGSSRDNGKAPSAISGTVRNYMVKMLSENKDAFFNRSSCDRRRELWEAFAKTHPHHSAASYMNYHASHYKDLERDARDMQKRSGGVPSHDGMSVDLGSSVATIAPKTVKRALGEPQSANRPSKKVRISQHNTTFEYSLPDNSSDSHC